MIHVDFHYRWCSSKDYFLPNIILFYCFILDLYEAIGFLVKFICYFEIYQAHLVNDGRVICGIWVN